MEVKAQSVLNVFQAVYTLIYAVRGEVQHECSLAYLVDPNNKPDNGT